MVPVIQGATKFTLTFAGVVIAEVARSKPRSYIRKVIEETLESSRQHLTACFAAPYRTIGGEGKYLAWISSHTVWPRRYAYDAADPVIINAPPGVEFLAK